MGNPSLNCNTVKLPKKKNNFPPKRTEIQLYNISQYKYIGFQFKGVNGVPWNGVVGGLCEMRRGRGGCIGWWGRWNVELRGFDEGEGLREGLGRVEERWRGWLRLWALNDFLIRWYLYHYGAFPLLLSLPVLLLFLFLLHYSSQIVAERNAFGFGWCRGGNIFFFFALLVKVGPGSNYGIL